MRRLAARRPLDPPSTPGRRPGTVSTPLLRRGACAAVVLLVGSLPYLARSADPAAVVWLHSAGLSQSAAAVRATREFVHAHVHLPSWFLGSASDAAYAFALGLLLADASRPVVLLGLLVALGHEIAQGLGWVAGTFDPVDLVVLFFSYVLAHLLFRPTKDLHHEPQDLHPARRPPLLRSPRDRQLVAEEG